MRQREGRVALDGLLEEPHRLGARLGAGPGKEVESLQVEVVGLGIRGRTLLQRRLLLRMQGDLQVFDDRLGDLVLDFEDIGFFAIEAFRPHMQAGPRIDELGGHAKPGAGFPDASLEDRADLEHLPDAADVEVLALQGERRCPGHHAHALKSRERVDEFLGESLAEVLVVPGRAHVDERQHGYRRIAAARRGGPSGGWRLGARSCQRLDEFSGVGIPIRGVLAQAPGDELIDPGREVGPQGRGARGLVVENLVEHRIAAVARERAAEGRHLEHGAAERPDVGVRPGLPAANLLGRHVGSGAEDRLRLGQVASALE